MTKTRKIRLILWLLLSGSTLPGFAQQPAASEGHPDLLWFKEAKFGLFIHWGLYSELGGQWEGKDYFGSGEWLMNRAKIPAARYAQIAARFNPVDFNAAQWAAIAKASGVKYIVITAKHHEGFAMFDSRATHFDIVDATPYKKDPMKALADATRAQGLKFGFYYSQFLDWHEPDGGGNTWDFPKKGKDYQRYYQTKAIPQLKELLSNYGPLGIVWFDMPGGLTTAQTREMIAPLRKLQPNCLFSSRVGHDLGDYRDFGDSEVPPVPIHQPWEAIFTDNDTWGYITRDKNFKSSTQIIQLLAEVASKGGNLMLNVGPDGRGNFPPYEVKYLLETGKWLNRYGESIYGTTYGLIPAQPWGVTTSRPGKLFLHVFTPPLDDTLHVPFSGARVSAVRVMGSGAPLPWTAEQDALHISLPARLPDARDAVVEVDYTGRLRDLSSDKTVTVSRQYSEIKIPVVRASFGGQATSKMMTYAHYFGDWKHDNLAMGLKDTTDAVNFDLHILQPGDYRIRLDYACAHQMAGREGTITVAGQTLYFQSLETGEYDSHKPLMYIDHSIGLVSIAHAGTYRLTIHPAGQLPGELFWLKDVIMEPIR